MLGNGILLMLNDHCFNRLIQTFIGIPNREKVKLFIKEKLLNLMHLRQDKGIKSNF